MIGALLAADAMYNKFVDSVISVYLLGECHYKMFGISMIELSLPWFPSLSQIKPIKHTTINSEHTTINSEHISIK